MADVPPLLHAKGKASVQINGLFVAIDDAKFSLERFSRPLVFYNDGSAYSVSVAGSCMLARYRGENLLIATRHQLGKGEEKRAETEACIALYDDAASSKPTLLTPSGGITATFDDPGDKFLEDILILLFERGDKTAQLSTHFIRLDDTKTLNEVEPRRILGYLTIACPTSGSEPILTPDCMSYEEFKTGFVRLALEPAHAPSDDHHMAFRVKEKVQKSRDFDGYSGAPVYFYYNDEGGQAHLGWVGIIRAGGNGLLHVHLADEIKRNYLSARTRPGAGAQTVRPR
jgi:hypothetical protein